MDLIHSRPSCSTNLNEDEDILVDIVANDDDDDDRHIRCAESNIFRGMDMETSPTKLSNMNVYDIHPASSMVFTNDEEFNILSGGENTYNIFDNDFHHTSANVSDRESIFYDNNFEFYALDEYSSQEHLVCERCESRPLFETREMFNNHCQSYHGGLIAVCACPDPTCALVLSSVSAVKRHLVVDHKLPLETHFKNFRNIVDFNEWIIFLQYSTDSRYVMHNRQQPRRRQLLFCACSDHRKVNNNINAMVKPKGCCPSHINYTINNDGVDVVYQMFHYGHNEKSLKVLLAQKPWSLPKANRNRPNFPSKPLLTGSRPMQYIQVDVVAMTETKYRDTKYSCVLIVTDLFSKFMFARSLINGDSEAQKRIITRLLMEIFSTFGVPVEVVLEGYSSVFGKMLIDECMEQIANSFCIEICPICTTTPCYSAFRKNVEIRAGGELGSLARWPEALPTAILTHNQTPHAIFQYRVSPFEAMFGRRAWYKTDSDSALPWLQITGVDCDNNQAHAFRQHNSSNRILDSIGKPLEGQLLHKMQRIISAIEARCDNWYELTCVNPDIDRALINRLFGLSHSFLPGDYVYVRLLNIPCEKDSCLKGVIVETKFDASNHFPYRVYIQDGGTTESTSKSDEMCFNLTVHSSKTSTLHLSDEPSFWVSPYDICASSLEQEVRRQPNFAENMDYLFCKCSRNCSLFKSENCPFELSKRCCDEKCERNSKQCAFHSIYDSAVVPVNNLVQNYSQNPERVIHQVNVQRRAFLSRQLMSDVQGISNDFSKANDDIFIKHGSHQKASMEYMKEVVSRPIIIDDGQLEDSERIGEEIGAEVLVESEDVSSKAQIYCLENDTVLKRQRLRQIKEELSELEFRIFASRKTGNLSEEALLLESSASVLREKCAKLQRDLHSCERMRRLQQMADDALPPVAVKKNYHPGTFNIRKRSFLPTKCDAEQQTKYLVEEDQVFPLISIVSTSYEVADGVLNSGDTYTETEEDFEIRRKRGILRRNIRKTHSTFSI